MWDTRKLDLYGMEFIPVREYSQLFITDARTPPVFQVAVAHLPLSTAPLHFFACSQHRRTRYTAEVRDGGTDVPGQCWSVTLGWFCGSGIEVTARQPTPTPSEYVFSTLHMAEYVFIKDTATAFVS